MTGCRPRRYGKPVHLQLRQRFDAAAIVEPIPARRTWDWVLTGLLAAAAVAFVLFDDSLPLWAQVLPAVIATAFVPFRRDIPLVAVITTGVVAATCVALALRGAEVDDVGSPAGLADVVLFYALCRWSTPVRIAIGFVVSVASEITIGWASGGADVGEWPQLLPWLLIVAFALAMRYRARAIAGRYEQVRLEERNALARELHDIVAHHMSAVAVQAQAGQFVVDADPKAAADALRSIETIANESIDEMRRMVGILCSEDDRGRTVAPDSLTVLAVRDGRPAVYVRGDVELDDLPAGVAAALFRIAQESITNARRHSRGATFVEVSVERGEGHVRMTVDNDGMPTTRNSGSGYGEVGMRERVEALGGEFESAARPSLGWRTSTSIPVGRTDR